MTDVMEAAEEGGQIASVTHAASKSVPRPCRTVPPDPPCAVVPAEQHVRRYVPFFVASLVLTLTLGATLGAVSLARLTGTWGVLPRPWVWAHGYVQLFGFLALFVMGFAYHAVPRFVGTALVWPRVVPLTLWLQTTGVILVAFVFLMPESTGGARALWTLGGALLLVSAALFAAAIAGTIRGRSSERQAFEPWILAGALWLVVASGVACTAAVHDDTTWHNVLWPAALYGFGGSWVFGVGRRLFPSSLGWRTRWPSLDRPVFWLYQGALGAWCAGAWPLELWSRPARALGAAGLLVAVPLLAAITGLVGPRRFPLSPHNREARLYARYVGAGWAWLFVGLVAGPGWTLAVLAGGDPPSITMLDFSRHTVALGFVTQVIVAVGSRFIPVFCGSRLWSLRAHASGFWLLNAAVAIRGVEAALGAGYWPEAWPLLALAGPPAVAALVIFAANVFVAIGSRPHHVLARGAPGRLPLAGA